jgi:hypothetical protein
MLSARLIKKLEGIEKCSKNGHKEVTILEIINVRKKWKAG